MSVKQRKTNLKNARELLVLSMEEMSKCWASRKKVIFFRSNQGQSCWVMVGSGSGVI